ncbi:hypothetical protein D3C78_900860 [compost metagenome]
MTFIHVRPRQHDLRTQRPQMEDFFAAHFVGHHQNQGIAFLRGNQRQPEPGISGGGFNNGTARCEQPFALGFIDHRQRHAVFDGAARILVFEFQKERARTGIQLMQLNHRRAANQFGNGVINRHGLFLKGDMAG